MTKIIWLVSIVASLALTLKPCQARRLRELTIQSIPAEQEENQGLRVLTFGTSHSFGVWLEDRFKQAYPWILSPDATNLALRANGPAYPALCTESMVGDDDIYDVIILEYHLRAPEGLQVLAQRLRERFPDALIIFFKIWHPFYVRRKDSRQNFFEWVTETVGENIPLQSDLIHEAMLQTKEEDWTYVQQPQCDSAIEEAATAVGGYIYELPKNASPRMAIIHHSHWFAKDFHHLSERGHALVANGISKLINQYGSRSDRLGTWSGGDSCQSWFTDGNVEVSYEGNIQVAQFGDGKHALEVYMGEGGNLQVMNPFDTVRTLYLTYMAMGPAPSLYPTTKVILMNEDSQNLGVDMDLDPTSYVPDGHRVHVAKVTKVGSVPPGRTIVNLRPLQDTELHFRLTGISLTSDFGFDYVLYGNQN